jgi:hypothetical protein
MSKETFCAALAALVRGAAESGLDVFFLHSELTLAGMALVDDCRVDLAEIDETEESPY